MHCFGVIQKYFLKPFVFIVSSYDSEIDSKEGFPQQLSQPRAPPSQPSGGLVGVCARHDFNSLPCRSVPDNELMRTFYHKKNYTYTSLSSIIALYKIVYH